MTSEADQQPAKNENDPPVSEGCSKLTIVCRPSSSVSYYLWHVPWHTRANIMCMLIALLVFLGIGCFAILYWSIEFFEKI